MHGIYYCPVLSLVLTAFPGRQMGLPFFNDHRCGSVAELRSVIEKARAFALENAEHERAAAMLKRRLLAELERERAARRAAGDRGKRTFRVPMCRRRHVSRARALPRRPLPIE